MTDRIKEIAGFYNLSSTAFADQVEIPRPVVSHIFSGRNRPSLEVVQKIGVAFPEVQLSWLLYGKGEMFQKASPPKSDGAPVIREQAAPVPVPAEKTEKADSVKSEIIAAESKVPLPKKKPEKRTVKIVFIYDDNSFDEFRP